MLRIVVQDVTCAPSGDIHGHRMHTFDIDAPELEEHLRDAGYVFSSVVGVELLERAASAGRSK